MLFVPCEKWCYPFSLSVKVRVILIPYVCPSCRELFQLKGGGVVDHSNSAVVFSLASLKITNKNNTSCIVAMTTCLRLDTEHSKELFKSSPTAKIRI